MSPARARLKDVAAATGFSTNTVSLALRKSALVTRQTAQIIERAARELGYRPNEVAKSLVQRQTRSVGLLLTNILNPILTATAQAAETALAARGYSTLFATSSHAIDLEKRALELFCGRQVDGLLVYPAHHRELEHIRALQALKIPIVLLAGEAASTIDTVGLRESLGAYRATRHLLDLGHRRIGMVDSGSLLGNTEKVDGYRRALAEAGVSFDPALLRITPGYSPTIGSAAMAELMRLPDSPTAVFGANDSIAIGVMDWCLGNGRRVPEDISVVGYDNIELSAYAATPLTTVNYDAEMLAQRAVARLLCLIDADDPQPPSTQLFDPELVIRKSTAPARGGA